MRFDLSKMKTVAEGAIVVIAALLMWSIMLGMPLGLALFIYKMTTSVAMSIVTFIAIVCIMGTVTDALGLYELPE